MVGKNFLKRKEVRNVYQKQAKIYDLGIYLYAYTLIETAKLNNVDPQAWLTDTLSRISDYKITRIDELLPWRYAQT